MCDYLMHAVFTVDFLSIDKEVCIASPTEIGSAMCFWKCWTLGHFARIGNALNKWLVRRTDRLHWFAVHDAMAQNKLSFA